MKYQTTIFLILVLGSFLSLAAQTTYVPDDNFEQRLIDLGLDDVLDNYVLTSNISGVTHLDIQNKNISDLTGLEHFSSLTHIMLDGNPVGTIPFHPSVNLTFLICQYTQLTELDLTPHTNLDTLACAGNNLTSLDLSQNPNLIDLICGHNQLTEIVLHPEMNLHLFDCDGNNLTSLDMSQHIRLNYFGCSLNQLTELDLSNNINLLEVRAHSNPPMEKVDIRNGNNMNITQFSIYNCPNLPYIYVDDYEYSTTNWTDIDPTTTFVEMEGQTECEMIGVADNFLDQNLTIYPNPVIDFITIESANSLNIEEITILNISGKKLKTSFSDFEKIDFKNLASGVYYLKIQSNKGIVFKKVLKT